MIDLELAYIIAKEIGLNGEEFALFVKECNEGKGGEWLEIIENECWNSDAVTKFYDFLGLPPKRVFQVSIDVEATEDFEPYDLIKKLREDYVILGWDQDVSWSLTDYRKGIN